LKIKNKDLSICFHVNEPASCHSLSPERSQVCDVLNLGFHVQETTFQFHVLGEAIKDYQQTEH
jgi:hypothetical protein